MMQTHMKRLQAFALIYFGLGSGRCYFSSSPLSVAKPMISRLSNRSILILHGPEAYKLLQGLTTNDLNLLSSRNLRTKAQNQEKKLSITDRLSIYTLFLSPKGKLITDAFIYKPKVFLDGKRSFRQDQLWIDVNSSLKNELFFHLKKYLWKKQVQLIDVDKEQDSHKPAIYAGYNHISTISCHIDQGCQVQMPRQEYREEEYSNLMMFDPRGGNYGRRIVCMQQELGIPAKQFQYVPQSQYEDFQRTIGFTPSSISTKKLPFQFNFDLLNAISFKKGCYLGQQIVSRSYFTGIVRRRVFPFLLQNQEILTEQQTKSIHQGVKLLDQSGQQVGKVVFYQRGKTGLALASYLNYFKESVQIGQDQIEQQKAQAQTMLSISIKQPLKGYIFCPFQKQLSNYIVQTRKKQKNLEQLDI